MDFSQKKLPKTAAHRMRVCPIETVKPHALMLAPVYVFMKENEKFLAVKAPLDFFTPEELERLKPFESFFMPDFMETTFPFREAARTVRALLEWNPKVEYEDDSDLYPEEQIPPAPFELSDAILRKLGPLWGYSPEGPVIEPFFVAVFVNELCDFLGADIVREARDESVLRYEQAIFLSSWSVFLALHLGMCDLEFLNHLRLTIFKQALEGQVDETGDVGDLIRVARSTIDGRLYGRIGSQDFTDKQGRVFEKISTRVERVKKLFVKESSFVATIHGLKGFVDV